MYVAGYALECLLKAKLMRRFDCRNLGELEDELGRRNLLPGHVTIYTHHFETLLELTGGLARLRSNRSLWPRFNVANRWVPAWRYDPDLSDSEQAEDFLDAIDTILHWVENNT